MSTLTSSAPKEKFTTGRVVKKNSVFKAKDKDELSRTNILA